MQIARLVPRLTTATRTSLPVRLQNSLAAMSTAAAAPVEPEVLQEQKGQLAILTLNRPKALNALTTGMVEDLYKKLRQYETNPSISAVLINGAGGKAFCAGGDVKAVVQMSQAGQIEDAMRFFRSEYHLNYKIATLKKPYIALLDGITMGGGVGVSIHGTFRIATEKTLFAMPECAIGLIPDVGGSFFLPRLPDSLGMYIGLTGCRLKGVDVLYAGLATHYISSQLLPELQNAILQCINSNKTTSKTQLETSLRSLFTEFQSRAPLPAGELPHQMETISCIFGGGKKSVEEIYEACNAPSSGEFGKMAVELMAKGSPTSQRIVFEQLHRGASMPLDECLKMEYRLVHHLVAKNGSDFHQGVTAALITRTGAPVWHPPSLMEVSAESISGLFERLPPEQELQLEAVSHPSKL